MNGETERGGGGERKVEKKIPLRVVVFDDRKHAGMWRPKEREREQTGAKMEKKEEEKEKEMFPVRLPGPDQRARKKNKTAEDQRRDERERVKERRQVKYSKETN